MPLASISSYSYVFDIIQELWLDFLMFIKLEVSALHNLVFSTCSCNYNYMQTHTLNS